MTSTVLLHSVRVRDLPGWDGREGVGASIGGGQWTKSHIGSYRPVICGCTIWTSAATGVRSCASTESPATRGCDVARILTSAGRVVSVDMRGFGDSQWSPEQRYTTNDHVSDLAHIVDDLGADQVDIAGSSWGTRRHRVRLHLSGSCSQACPCGRCAVVGPRARRGPAQAGFLRRPHAGCRSRTSGQSACT